MKKRIGIYRDEIFVTIGFYTQLTQKKLFLKNVKSAMELFNTIDYFSTYSGLNLNILKCKIVGVGEVAVCSLKSVEMTLNTMKILGVHFSHNKKLQNEKNFCKVILQTQCTFKSCRMGSLTIEGNITIFKPLVLSKVVYLAFSY